jgi:glutathione synthase/RimK-type ligase-like ATP-grasp enzyme
MVSTLETLEDISAFWPRPLLNQPSRIFDLERDRFYEKMFALSNVVIPKTARVTRTTLEHLSSGQIDIKSLLSDAQYPIIVRPVNSHAGHGLEKIDMADMLAIYLSCNPEQEFFIARFVDYSSDDGLFRKYRVVFIDGQPFACHMAIADEWKVWYLNANMYGNASKREEEARFMRDFETEFAARHAAAFKSIVDTIGLDYFGIDCGETKDGQLLLFEGETAMIVHDMDSSEVYPYKVPQMRKLFAAFVAMLYRRAKSGQAQAA